MAKIDNKTIQSLDINASTFIGSQYSQVVGVSVTDNDVTLDFVYVNPQIKTKGQTVARVTLPRETAQQVSSLITDTIKKHDADKNK